MQAVFLMQQPINQFTFFAFEARQGIQHTMTVKNSNKTSHSMLSRCTTERSNVVDKMWLQLRHVRSLSKVCLAKLSKTFVSLCLNR